MKICITCKQELPLEQFSKDKTKKDGLQCVCKQCNKQYLKQYYQENSEHFKQYNKQWKQDNPERHKQHVKQLNSSIKPGIYMVKCLLNGDCYIGQSKRPYQRKTQHFTNCKTDGSKTSTNPQLQHDLKQYGKNAFVFGVIEHCELEQLSERETYWINQFQPTYNTNKLN